MNRLQDDGVESQTAQGSARSVLGVAGNSTADLASIQSSATGQILNSTATTVGVVGVSGRGFATLPSVRGEAYGEVNEWLDELEMFLLLAA